MSGVLMLLGRAEAGKGERMRWAQLQVGPWLVAVGALGVTFWVCLDLAYGDSWPCGGLAW